jgi:hypothetical protein
LTKPLASKPDLGEEIKKMLVGEDKRGVTDGGGGFIQRKLKDDGTGGVNQIGDEVKKVIQGEDRNKK